MSYYLKDIKEKLDYNNLKNFLQKYLSNYISQVTEEIFDNIENNEKTLILSFGGSIDYNKINLDANIVIHEVSEEFINDKFKNKTIINQFDKINFAEFKNIVILDLYYQNNVIHNLRNISESINYDSKIFIVTKSLIWNFAYNLIFNNLFFKKKIKTNFLPFNFFQSLIDVSGNSLIRNIKFCLIPFNIPILTKFLNKIIRLPLINFFASTNLLILKKSNFLKFRDTKTSISIVVPCKNEEKNIRLFQNVVTQFDDNVEFLFGDDNSEDKTKNEIYNLIKNQAKDRARIKFYEGPGICKSENVYKGIDYASNEIVVILDADLTVKISDMKMALDAFIESDIDFLNCTRLIYPRSKKSMKKSNFFGNILFAYFFSIIFKQKITDTLCGTKVFYKKDFLRFKKYNGTWGIKDKWGDFDLLLGAYRINLKIREYPVSYEDRIEGDTKMTNVFLNGLRMLYIIINGFIKIRF